MSSFHWETEEEGDDTPPLTESSTGHSRRRLVIIVATLIVLVVAAAAVAWRLIDQAEIQEEQVELDIISAYRIWREAVNQSDSELLNTIIVDDDPRWTATQRQLLQTGLLIKRPGFGLQATSPFLLPENPTYDLSNDWRRADLYFTQEYIAEPGNEGVEVIELTHTVGFRREGSRWLYSHSAGAFWGESLISELDNLTVTYPERDQAIVLNLANDLDQVLGAVCRDVLEIRCPLDTHIELVFEVNPSILLKVSDPDLPEFSGRAFVLPAPTILGTPTDDHSYQSIFNSYAHPIAAAFKAGLSSPIPLPDQVLQLLCYSDFGAKPKLFGYDAADDSWTVTMPERSFQFLSALADDEGLLLQEYPPNAEVSNFSLISWSASDSRHLFDYGMSVIQAFPAGEYTLLERPDILMRTISTRPDKVQFNMIDGSICDDDGCKTIELDGFPVWSGNRQHTLLWQGGTVSLGDSQGTADAEIGEGFTPFWIDDHFFGLAQFTETENRSEVVLYYANTDDLTLKPLATSTLLAEVVDLPGNSPIFIQLAAPRPNKEHEIIILAREYAGNKSRYFLFDVNISVDGSELSIDVVEELAIIIGTPGSYPSSSTPTGQIPFVFSSDGNHITIGRKADSDVHHWELHIIGIDDGSQEIYKTTYPAHTFLHPYFDWSLDGQWLAVIDDGFVQLLSPERNYRRLIAHDMHACSHVAWVNR